MRSRWRSGATTTIIEPVHLLVALLDQPGGSTRPLLSQAGVNVPLLRERLGEALEKLPKVTGQAGNISVGNDLVAPAQRHRQAGPAARRCLHRQRAVRAGRPR